MSNSRIDTLHATMAETLALGDYAAAEPIARDLRDATNGLRWRWDGAAMVSRANALYVMSQACFQRDQVEVAEEHILDGFAAAARAAKVRNPLAALVHAKLLVANADLCFIRGDVEDGIEQAALAIDQPDPLTEHGGTPGWHEVDVNARLAMSTGLRAQGRWHAAESWARAALEIASERWPAAVPLVLAELSSSRREAGGTDDAAPQLHAAHVIAQAHDNLPARARAEVERNLGSLALQRSDHEAADRHLREAERLFLADGERRLAAAAKVGYAEVARLRGDPDRAARLAHDAFAANHDSSEWRGGIEALTVLGDAEFDRGRALDAATAYDRARGLASEVEEAPELVRLDVKRARAAHAVAASRPHDAAHWIARAEDIAIPAALAADAIGADLPPGEIRETWMREVVGSAHDVALRILADQGKTRALVELLELIAAGASLDPLDNDDDDDDQLVDLPPRVRGFRFGDPLLEGAIRAVPERYGLDARSDEVVDAW